jgi:hypothetical protein
MMGPALDIDETEGLAGNLRIPRKAQGVKLVRVDSHADTPDLADEQAALLVLKNGEDRRTFRSWKAICRG